VAKHQGTLIPAAVWWVPPVVVALSGIRLMVLVLEMKRIAEYLRRLEQNAFGDDSPCPGWERFKLVSVRSVFDRMTTGLAAGLWVLVLAVTCIISAVLS
jgi:hypothetical protein